MITSNNSVRLHRLLRPSDAGTESGVLYAGKRIVEGRIQKAGGSCQKKKEIPAGSGAADSLRYRNPNQ